MKILKGIIDKLPTDLVVNNDDKYHINISLLLKKFLDYEIDVADDFYEKHSNNKTMGSLIEYLQQLKAYWVFEENSYNWSGRISNDFYYNAFTLEGALYMAMQINMGTDARCHSYDNSNNSSYTDAFLLKFKNCQEFYELLDEATIENATFDIEVDNNVYLVTPKIIGDDLQVKCMENGEDISDIYAANDSEFAEQIRNYSNDKQKVLAKI